MARAKTPKSTMTAKAVLSAKAVASAKFTRKRIIQESVPADVTRARATAWLDVISPLTEWAGLKGDELRHKRVQLRLQREDVLTRIAEKCTKRLGLRPPNSVPVPNKFLVPFLEQASLEDPDSSLVDMWANLFVSASEDFESYHTHFVSIISRLSHKQAEIFATIADAESEHDLELSVDNIEAYYRQHRIKRRVLEAFKQLTAIPSSMDDFCQFIHDHMDLPGLAIVHASAENRKTKQYFDITLDYMFFEDADAVDYSILEANGLISYVDTDFFGVGKWDLLLLYYHLTPLGFHFAKACKIITGPSC
jgi:hypothetical protein